MAYPIVTNGKTFVDEVLKEGTVALWSPPEGGFEGNYRRRVREAGYVSLQMSARGLGDPARYLTENHTVRPAHLGKKDKYVHNFPPIIQTNLASLPPNAKGLLLWIIEGKVLAVQELEFLILLTSQETRVKIVIEMGSDPKVRWQPLRTYLQERGF